MRVPSSLKDEGIKGKQRGTEEKVKKKVLLKTCLVAHFTGAERGRWLHYYNWEIQGQREGDRVQGQALSPVRALMEEAGFLCHGCSLQWWMERLTVTAS